MPSLIALIFGISVPALAGRAPTLILVDKKTNLLHVAEYQKDDSLKTLATFHTTMGKVKGDKAEEGDLKTPEGVYQIQGRRLPPALAPKFGVMAFTVNYPNAYDHIAGATGTGIMLHGTNAPDRMKKDFDSEGCVVLENSDLLKVEPFIRLGLTPILIFDELTPEYATGQRSQKLHDFFDSWIRAWEARDIDSYMNHYHTDFASMGRNRAQWRDYKNVLNKKYRKITVGASAPYFFRHPKYTMLIFTQDYKSELQGGGPGLVSRGTKILYFAEESGVPKIVSESFTELMW